MAFINPRDFVTYLRAEIIYGVPSTDDNLRNILATLDLQETLILCARLNAIISGIGTASMEERTHKAMTFLNLPRQERRIRKVLKPLGGYERIHVFFRGQLLELMRLAMKYCSRDPLPGCYAFAFDRKQFLKAALI